MVKFVSYDGAFPNYCHGTLVLEINGERTVLKNILISLGDPYGDITEGPWTLDEFFLPDELKEYYDEIWLCVNENIPEGCCGGCRL